MATSESAHPPAFLLSAISPSEAKDASRPWVTLTYAQSLDGCIAGVGGQQLILSGKESMVMTHWMRTMHDGILVGIGTALNDNPQLNARHLPSRVEYTLPTPIILDSDLRFSTSCKLLNNCKAGNGRQPWVVCSDAFSEEKRQRKKQLEEAGARVLEVPRTADQGISIDDLLTALRQEGITSLMVEGGQRVIGSFLCHQDSASKPVVDVVIVTVAPTLVGEAGVGVLPKGLTKIPMLEHIASSQFGKDSVIACRIAK
ncbi:hypothetical protein M422DRAFT_64394 [Sphaerobolus stellatus SS14]|nr:hypothetical protein M422DRAFT_64394 [Sphaerobolus stellatus SS14]